MHKYMYSVYNIHDYMLYVLFLPEDSQASLMVFLMLLVMTLDIQYMRVHGLYMFQYTFIDICTYGCVFRIAITLI